MEGVRFKVYTLLLTDEAIVSISALAAAPPPQRSHSAPHVYYYRLTRSAGLLRRYLTPVHLCNLVTTTAAHPADGYQLPPTSGLLQNRPRGDCESVYPKRRVSHRTRFTRRSPPNPIRLIGNLCAIFRM